MAAAGVFQFINNDGKIDTLLNSKQVLEAQIKNIQRAKMIQAQQNNSRGIRGKNPDSYKVSPADIERTHVIPFNAQFRPVVPCVMEYIKINTNSGVSTFGSSITFSLPQGGDFIHDIVTRYSCTSFTCNTVPCPAPPAPSTTGIGTDTYTNTVYSFVDAYGRTIAPDTPVRNFVHYCDLPGIRLQEKHSINVNNNPIDSYTPITMVNYHKHIIDDRNYAWLRCIGQEVPITGYTDLTTINGKYNATDTSRRTVEILNGPQTPKAEQPNLDLWVPSIHWFNTDPRISFPSLNIPYGQRYIEQNLAPKAKLFEVVPGDVFLETRTTVEVLTGVDVGPVLSSSTTVTRTPYLLDGSTSNGPDLQKVEMYCNNIYTDPVVHEVYANRVQFTLARFFLEQSVNVNTSDPEIQLQNLKWPVEYFFFNLHPSANENSHTNWYKSNYFTQEHSRSYAKTYVIADPTDITASPPMHTNLADTSIVHYSRSQKLPLRFTITCSSINLYSDISTDFFANYLIHTRGGNNSRIKSYKHDDGSCFVSFAVHPGTYQPSSHLNISRSRDFYIKTSSALIPSPVPTAVLHVAACAINFLLTSDGNIIVRYAT